MEKYMGSAKIDARKRLTIPKAIRDALSLKPGDRLDLSEKENGTIVLTPLPRGPCEVI